MANLPSLSSPAVDAGGFFSTAWTSFFSGLSGKPAAIEDVAASGSPFTYQAQASGVLAVSGGKVSAVSLTRGRTTIPLAVGGNIPVSQGDAVTITYTAPPALAFVPT